MALYPKLNKKLGLIGALCLITWGLFILGMQVYFIQIYQPKKCQTIHTHIAVFFVSMLVVRVWLLQ